MGTVPGAADEPGSVDAAGETGALADAGDDAGTGDDKGSDADPLGVTGEADVGGPGLTRRVADVHALTVRAVAATTAAVTLRADAVRAVTTRRDFMHRP